MMSRGPKAMSPAAKIPGAVVISVSGSIFSVPWRVVSMPSEGLRKARSEACPMARITVSHGMTVSVPSANFGLKRLCSSKTEMQRITSSPVSLPFLPMNCFGPREGWTLMPSIKVHPSLGPKRSEEHTSELQSPYDLVCRLLLEKKKEPQGLAESDDVGHVL